ncbi:unnamed protein product [Camellia sinensis]
MLLERFTKEDGPVELHEREVTRLRSEKGSRLWIRIETGIETVTSRVEARGGEEIMNTGFLVILLRSGPPVATAPQISYSMASQDCCAYRWYSCRYKIELELRPQGKLTVTVMKANDLKNMEMIGKSDPYVVVYIRPLFKVKTKVIDNDLNPIWNQTFELIAEDKETQSLILDVLIHMPLALRGIELRILSIGPKNSCCCIKFVGRCGNLLWPGCNTDRLEYTGIPHVHYCSSSVIMCSCWIDRDVYVDVLISSSVTTVATPSLPAIAVATSNVFKTGPMCCIINLIQEQLAALEAEKMILEERKKLKAAGDDPRREKETQSSRSYRNWMIQVYNHHFGEDD